MLRFYMLAFTSLFAILTSESWCHGEMPPSLMTAITEWQYPGSKINGASLRDAATMNASGERTVPSVQLGVTGFPPCIKALWYMVLR